MQPIPTVCLQWCFPVWFLELEHLWACNSFSSLVVMSFYFLPWSYLRSLCRLCRSLSLRPFVSDSVKKKKNVHKHQVYSSVAAALRKYQRNNDSTRALQTAESVGKDNSKHLRAYTPTINNNYSIDFMALYILAIYFTFITATVSSRSPMKQSK